MSEGGEVVDEDTSQNIAEEHVHENHVDHIVGEPATFEFLHVLSYLFLYVKLDHAVEYSLAVGVRVAVRIDGLSILAQGKHREEGDEADSEEGQNSQHFKRHLQSSDDTGQNIKLGHHQIH